MENTMVRPNASLSRLETLAHQAKIYAAGATMNMLQLGRVFIEAKDMLKHGEFAAWCEENAGCSIRTAQNMMSAYTRFGDKPEFLEIGKSKLFKMLTLPEGSEEKFIADNDLKAMSSRDVDKAIREIKQAYTGSTGEPDGSEDEHASVPDEALVNELRSVKEDRDRLARENREMLDIRAKLNFEIREMRDGSAMDAQLIEEQQETINKLNTELDRFRVSQARGEMANNTSEMDSEAFRRAVQEFMGCVHQVPSMGSVFATMDHEERIVFDTLLKSVEAWAKGARSAIDTVEGRFVS